MQKKRIVLTIICCLLPALAGVIVYKRIPEPMPIFWSTQQEAVRFVSKAVFLFGFPILMAVIQTFCMLLVCVGMKRKSISTIDDMFLWLIPGITYLVYFVTVSRARNPHIPTQKIVLLVMGFLFLQLGRHIPRMKYETGRVLFHPTPNNEEEFRLMSKIFGCAFMLGGLTIWIAIFFV